MTLPRELRRCPAGVDPVRFLAELEWFAAHHVIDDDEYLAAVESAEPKRPAPDLPLFKNP